MRLISSVLFALVAATSILQAVGEDCVPGYRACYPEQALGVSNLTLLPKMSRKGRFSFSDTNILCSPSLYKDTETETCLLAGVRDVWMGLSDKLHPKNTPYAVLGLNATYDGVPNWTWVSGISLQSAVTHFSLINNTRYIGALSGRYTMKQNLGLHAGVYSEVGFRASIVRPIAGLDYTKGNWLFEAIYPVKAGVVYKGFDKHLFSTILRPFYTALREEKGLKKSPAVATYKGAGLEFRYDFLPKHEFDVWIALGHTLNSNLSIGDKNNNHEHHIHLHGTPYANLGVMIAL